MQARPGSIFVAGVARMSCLTCVMLLMAAAEMRADWFRGGVVTRANVSRMQSEELAGKLRRITGWPDLKFDRQGFLRTGSIEPSGGSATSRKLMVRALSASHLVVLEDASNRSDVVFSRVVRGRWLTNRGDWPSAFIVLIDFADFEHVMGDRRALTAFDVGWAVLHEIDHIVNDSWDADSLGELGDCEMHINVMRRECNVPLRAEYFFTTLPQSNDSAFSRRLVRLSFAELDSTTNKSKRYWVVWDASLVGGLEDPREIATAR